MTSDDENLFAWYPPRPKEWLVQEARGLAARGWHEEDIVRALNISPAAVQSALQDFKPKRGKRS